MNEPDFNDCQLTRDEVRRLLLLDEDEYRAVLPAALATIRARHGDDAAEDIARSLVESRGRLKKRGITKG